MLTPRFWGPKNETPLAEQAPVPMEIKLSTRLERNAVTYHDHVVFGHELLHVAQGHVLTFRKGFSLSEAHEFTRGIPHHVRPLIWIAEHCRKLLVCCLGNNFHVLIVDSFALVKAPQNVAGSRGRVES